MRENTPLGSARAASAESFPPPVFRKSWYSGALGLQSARTTSRSPSRSASSRATPKGVLERGYVSAPNDQSPLLRRIERLLELELGTTRSGFPSPSRSAASMKLGPAPTRTGLDSLSNIPPPRFFTRRISSEAKNVAA